MTNRSIGGGRRLAVLMLRVGSSVVLLVALAWWLDLDQIGARLRQMRLSWVVLALALSVVQVLASAWRWRFTAGRLGVGLAFGPAVREYYLSMFVNQLLPGGVVGDVSRAWRHAAAERRASASTGPAITAVVLERLSGQMVMGVVALASVATLVAGPSSVVWVALAVTVAVGLLWWRERSPVDARASSSTSMSMAGRLWRDARVALLAGDAFPIQVASSLLVVGTYIATYLMAAQAVGVDTPLRTLAPLVAPVLVAMLIPASVAGWGVREAAAALLWSAVGLTSEDGVVISIAYGLLVLVSSLPGSAVLVRGMLGRPG